MVAFRKEKQDIAALQQKAGLFAMQQLSMGPMKRLFIAALLLPANLAFAQEASTTYDAAAPTLAEMAQQEAYAARRLISSRSRAASRIPGRRRRRACAFRGRR
jgi:hypothetical protein